MGAVNTVTICEDGKRWVSQIGNRHYKTHTQKLLMSLKFTERDTNEKGICLVTNEFNQDFIFFNAESVNACCWPLIFWEITWRIHGI